MRKFDSGIWQKSITGGVLRRPLGYFRAVGAKVSRAAAAAWLALDTSRADCHSPDQQVLLDDLKMLHVHVFLQPHWVPATWRSLAQTSLRGSSRPEMSPPRGFCGGSPGSAVRSRCWYGCASSARRENRSRSAIPRCRPRPFWRPPSASWRAAQKPRPSPSCSPGRGSP